jgi:hypothetical protein
MAKLSRYFALPPRERAGLAEAVLWLLAVRLILGLLPLRWALRLLRIAPGETGTGRIAADEADGISRAIARAARHVPFRAVCLQQAFAALLMLRRRGLAATVHFGLAREGGALSAHAWCRCGATPVTGAAEAPGFVPVAAFAA